jgi:hypothetical protein
MIRIKCIISCFVLIPIFGISQPGFLGSKNYISLCGIVNPTILSGSFLDKSIQLNKLELKEQRNMLDYGFELNYVRSYKNNISIGLSGTILRYQIPVYKDYYIKRFASQNYYNIDSIQTRCENLQFNQLSILPTLYFHTKNGMGPIGIYYSLGLGMSMSSLIDLNYAYQINQVPTNYGSTEEVWSPVDFYQNNQKWPPIYALSFRFGFGFNYPITEHLAWNLSFNYGINYNFKPAEEDFNSMHNDLFNFEDAYYVVQRKNLLLFSLGTGIVLLF